MNKKYAIGADIGGSHISAVIMDLEQEQILTESFACNPVDKNGTADEILESWAVALNQSLSNIDREQLTGIGFAMPGPFDYENGIALFTPEVAKYEKLNGVDVGAELKRRMQLPEEVVMRFMNDATSFAVGEAWIGKSSAYHKSIAITLGTGFGSAFIKSGIPVLEGNDVPEMGCFWHVPYKSGIADDYFSTRWFIGRYAEKTGVTLPGVKEIAQQAETSTTARDLFEEFGRNLGEFITPLIVEFNADCLVIGGNMVKAFDLWGPSLQSELNRQHRQLDVLLSDLMETSAMIGSARLLNEKFWGKMMPLVSKM